MRHLPGFWDAENWTADRWYAYQQRRIGEEGRKNARDQFWHRALGRLSFLPGLGPKWWHRREARQWPSKTGGGDHAEDEINWRIGRGEKKKADALLAEVRKRWPMFLA